MQIIVMSCWKYRDTWKPFFSLFYKFWPDCKYPVVLITDQAKGFSRANVQVAEYPGLSWCRMLFENVLRSDGPILMFQDDFFLSGPVHSHLIEYAIDQLHTRGAGSVRLYPCPGAEADYGDPYFGIVPHHTRYRTSCQATIWRPAYLAQIAARGETPMDFELLGSVFASTNLPDEVLAFKREVQPWPLEYLCSAIDRGKWNPDAKTLCEKHGILADWSLRPMKELIQA